MPKRLRRSSFALFAGLLLACNRGSTEPPPPPGGDDAPPAEEVAKSGDAATSADDGCRDWSTLDLAGLEPLPDTPYTPTFEVVWRTVLTKHYDPTIGCLDWPAIRLEYGQQLASAKDEAAAFGIMEQMLTRLGQSHMVLVPPTGKVTGDPRAAAKKSGSGRVPIEVRVIEGKAVVVNPATQGKKTGIPAGAQVLAVGDNQLAPLFENASAHQTREVEKTFAIRRVVDAWLHCAPGDKVSVQYQAFKAKKPKTRKVTCAPVDAELMSLGNLKNVPTVVRHRMIEGTDIGYLHFNVWMVPLMPKLEAALADLRGKGMKSLILDLRGNPGGVGTMVVPLGRRILPEPVGLGAMKMRDSTLTFNVPSVSDPFTGPMVLLIDEGTASTSEIFGQAMQDLKRATVYGAVPSQGAALPSVIETLPGGGMFQFVVADYKSPAGILVEGKGVVPDVVVPETQQAFAKGADPVLDKAVADLGGK